MTFVVFSIFYSSMSQFVVCSNTLRMRESMWSRSCGCVYNCIQSTLCSAFSPLLLLHRNICYKIEAKYKYKYFYHDLLNTFIFRYIYVFIKLFSLVYALFFCCCRFNAWVLLLVKSVYLFINVFIQLLLFLFFRTGV